MMFVHLNADCSPCVVNIDLLVGARWDEENEELTLWPPYAETSEDSGTIVFRGPKARDFWDMLIRLAVPTSYLKGTS